MPFLGSPPAWTYPPTSKGKFLLGQLGRSSRKRVTRKGNSEADRGSKLLRLVALPTTPCHRHETPQEVRKPFTGLGNLGDEAKFPLKAIQTTLEELHGWWKGKYGCARAGPAP